MSENLVNLNVNPCKMCMPMGAATALYGIKGCMSILHGSQGCATYIRRHMATHYNEPVDIASSALTEQGTVFGGEQNLISGLENLISLYHPDIIGVATTCLAETIGEDVNAIVRKFKDLHPESNVQIINVSSAGYAGTQYEGFFRALKAIVSQLEMDPTPNPIINIIAPMLSPADFRYIKALLDRMHVQYILLPDLSDNLDGAHEPTYNRLKKDGTPAEQIARMAGARYTIELSSFIDPSQSPAAYLYEKYGVAYERMPIPTGIRDTDRFIAKIKELGGTLPEALTRERGRYVDAMIDSHKYNAEGRAALFGEPDFVYAMTRLCCENGIVPVVVATGSVCPALREALESEIRECAERSFVKKTVLLDDCDFAVIESLCQELEVNMMIGSSDARRISHKLGLDLIRCAFPIHDRVGGGRIRTVGYEGSLTILDQITNSLLGNKEESFRDTITTRFFDQKEVNNKTEIKIDTQTNREIMDKKTASHPCFNSNGGGFARIHLPIAPKCNIQCNYCVRKFDCPNESRPGVTTEVLSPEEALRKYIAVKQKIPNLTVVGIAGPGDALANFESTRDTLRLIREYDPNVTFCLSTNGLMLPFYAQELIDLGVSHVTVTMNAVDAEIGSKIYKYVDYMGSRYIGVEGAAILLANQLSGLRYLASKGIVLKVNCVVLKGLNDTHIEAVVKKVKELGVSMTNVMQMIPVAGSAFEHMGLVSNKEIHRLRTQCDAHLKQMYHCRQCRADAVGTLDNDLSADFVGCSGSCADKNIVPAQKYAVASKSGMLVDRHFGHAEDFYIYESDGVKTKFVEKRSVAKYCTGKEDCGDPSDKMAGILSAVADCCTVIALRIGEAPANKLSAQGIRVISTYDRIEDAVAKAASQSST